MMLDSYVTLGKRIQPLRTRFSVNERASWYLPMDFTSRSQEWHEDGIVIVKMFPNSSSTNNDNGKNDVRWMPCAHCTQS